MPFKSQAQRRKFAELLVAGKIAPDTFEEWNRETGGQKLPERVTRKAGAKRTAGAKRRAGAKRTSGAKRKSGARRKTTTKRKAPAKRKKRQ